MRNLTMIVVALGVSASTVLAQDPLRADRDSIAEAEIEALEHHLVGLLERRELEEYASYLAEDYVRVNRQGLVSTKDEVLAAFASNAPAGLTPSDLRARIYGDTAVLTFVLTIARDGEPPVRSRLVKVFVRRDGGWILVHNQGTPLE